MYDLGNNKLLYSAQSQSFNPSSISQLANDYSDKILHDMTKQRLIDFRNLIKIILESN